MELLIRNKAMSKKNQLFTNPPYPVEQALKRLGSNLRTARLRRKLTIANIAEKIGTGPRAVADAEKGKASTAIGIYAALLWALGILEQIEPVADPAADREGQILARNREKTRARADTELDNDF